MIAGCFWENCDMIIQWSVSQYDPFVRCSSDDCKIIEQCLLDDQTMIVTWLWDDQRWWQDDGRMI